MADSRQRDSLRDIAVIGMAGRFPGARDVAAYWKNLASGVESISRLSDEDVVAAGIDHAMLSNPNFVKAAGVVDGADEFDAEFFGMNAREAEITDPQHRLFLECAWEALENAGYGAGFDGPVGVFGGSSINSYYVRNVLTNPDAASSAGVYQVFIGNDKDFIATRVSYKLNLKGPSLTIQTACSTSLVATHVACQNLLTHQADIALAGGVSVFFPQKSGYLYQEGMILSPDGHCRAFDARGQGTLGGQGVGIVVLKRLADALRDGDTIHAVIKGSAINNDGSGKVGFTAPSVDGQAEVIATAQAMASVSADSITYVEAHGTATPLGDPIEVAALTQVFGAATTRKQFCALGSVKTNIGHLDAAAGVAGLIKAVLALEHRLIPPSLHYEKANPQIDFDASPFFVNTRAAKWETEPGAPRRAGVSSFGIGGTNAHAVLEEAPPKVPSVAKHPSALLVWSAKTEQALAAATANLAEHLRSVTDLDLADVAYTLQVGRKPFAYRRSVVVADRDAAVALLTGNAAKLPTVNEARGKQPIVFMFSGQGSQYGGMTAELYRREPSFRKDVDHCAAVLQPLIGCDIAELLVAQGDAVAVADRRLTETRLTQPALFVVEYALARLWMRWGIRPHAMIGHSIGEYVAATLAEVMTVDDALATVALRGKLMQQLPSGSMLAVPLPEPEVRAQLEGTDADLAAVNGPAFCTVSGDAASIDVVERKFAAQGVECRRLHTSHAFHSAMMEPVIEPFMEHLRSVRLQQPRVRYVSNVSGTWIRPEEATDPAYWARHLRGAVRFADGFREVSKEARIVLEVGPGNTLCTFARQASGARSLEIVSSLPHASERGADAAFLFKTLGRLWQNGVPVDWAAVHEGDRLQRVPLPTYPFERQRYFIAPKALSVTRTTDVAKRSNVAEWLYLPSWKRRELVLAASPAPRRWVLFADEHGLCKDVAKRLVDAGHEVIEVGAGASVSLEPRDGYTVNPFRREDYATLFSYLAARGGVPSNIVSFLNCTKASSEWDSARDSTVDGGYPAFASVLALTQALAEHPGTGTATLFVVSNQLHSVTGDDPIVPLKALVSGLCKVVSQEYPQLRCRSIDLPIARSAAVADWVHEELLTDRTDTTVAYRGTSRWIQAFEPAELGAIPASAPWVKPGATYLITGGLGSVGLLFAEHMARQAKVRLVLVGRSPFPEREQWQASLSRLGAGDALGERIRRIEALERGGAEVMIAAADVSDLAQMRGLVDAVKARFGEIDGVIHAAGTVGGAFLPDIAQPQYDAQFATKVRGTQVLEQLFGNRTLDFCILVSSISTVLGGLGFAAYAASNAYLDAFVQSRAQTKTSNWRSIDWDGWNFVTDQAEGNLGASLRQLLMTPDESVQVLDAIQSLRAPRVVVSTANLDARLAQWVSQAPQDVTVVEATEALHARPRLASEYAEPRNDVERHIVRIWSQLLGIEQVGIHDDFFELGGHSLLGTRVLARIQETFEVKLPLRALFEAPTAGELAERIQTLLWVSSSKPDGAAVEEMEELHF